MLIPSKGNFTPRLLTPATVHRIITWDDATGTPDFARHNHTVSLERILCRAGPRSTRQNASKLILISSFLPSLISQGSFLFSEELANGSLTSWVLEKNRNGTATGLQSCNNNGRAQV